MTIISTPDKPEPTPTGAAPDEIRITLRHIRAQNGGAELSLSILLETGELREEKTLCLLADQYLGLRPEVGFLTRDAYGELCRADELCRAVRAGENLLSYGANSVLALTRKLTQKGFGREISAEAADLLRDRGLIDERRDLERETENALRKLWGERRIAAHLWNRGFSKETMSCLPDLLRDVDFPANCAALIRRHRKSLPDNEPERKRLVASLSRYGYSLSEIRSAFRLMEEND